MPLNDGRSSKRLAVDFLSCSEGYGMTAVGTSGKVGGVDEGWVGVGRYMILMVCFDMIGKGTV